MNNQTQGIQIQALNTYTGVHETGILAWDTDTDPNNPGYIVGFHDLTLLGGWNNVAIDATNDADALAEAFEIFEAAVAHNAEIARQEAAYADEIL